MNILMQIVTTYLMENKRRQNISKSLKKFYAGKKLERLGYHKVTIGGDGYSGKFYLPNLYEQYK